MKKIIPLSAFLIILLLACKKDKHDLPIGTINVDIDGIAKTFSVNAKATRILVSGGYGIQVQGYFKSTSTTNLIFTIVRPNPIATETYVENAGGNPLITMTHCIEVLYPCLLQAREYGSLANPVSIAITEINSTSVKGTFKGELQGNNSKMVFSNGRFYVSF